MEDEGEELAPSGCSCAVCMNDIKLTDEVFLLRVVHPFIVNNQLQYYDIIENNGQYKYPPIFFDFGCWEEEEEEVHGIQEDVPPVPDPSGVILCDICESDICQGEAMGLVQFGEIRLSERSPNNTMTSSFVGMSDPKHICIACLVYLEDNQSEPLWTDDIDPVPDHDVCIEGIHERCWRNGNCACPKRICEI